MPYHKFYWFDLHPKADCVVATDAPNVGAADAPNVDVWPNTLFAGWAPKFDPNAGFAAWLLPKANVNKNHPYHLNNSKTDGIFMEIGILGYREHFKNTYIQTMLTVGFARILSWRMVSIDQTLLLPINSPKT